MDDIFVVGYHCRDGAGLATLNWLPHDNPVALMTVSQHNKIVAGLQDLHANEIDLLSERNYQLRIQSNTLLEALAGAVHSMWHSESNMDNAAAEAEAVVARCRGQ